MYISIQIIMKSIDNNTTCFLSTKSAY